MESKFVAIWILMTFGSGFVGAACSRMIKGNKSIVAAALLPWLTILTFNLYSEFYAQQKELLQATGIFFQAVFGTIVAVCGLIGYWISRKYITK